MDEHKVPTFAVSLFNIFKNSGYVHNVFYQMSSVIDEGHELDCSLLVESPQNHICNNAQSGSETDSYLNADLGESKQGVFSKSIIN